MTEHSTYKSVRGNYIALTNDLLKKLPRKKISPDISEFDGRGIISVDNEQLKAKGLEKKGIGESQIDEVRTLRFYGILLNQIQYQASLLPIGTVYKGPREVPSEIFPFDELSRAYNDISNRFVQRLKGPREVIRSLGEKITVLIATETKHLGSLDRLPLEERESLVYSAENCMGLLEVLRKRESDRFGGNSGK